jgi:hypothetical protein
MFRLKSFSLNGAPYNGPEGATIQPYKFSFGPEAENSPEYTTQEVHANAQLANDTRLDQLQPFCANRATAFIEMLNRGMQAAN